RPPLSSPIRKGGNGGPLSRPPPIEAHPAAGGDRLDVGPAQRLLPMRLRHHDGGPPAAPIMPEAARPCPSSGTPAATVLPCSVAPRPPAEAPTCRTTPNRRGSPPPPNRLPRH